MGLGMSAASSGAVSSGAVPPTSNGIVLGSVLEPGRYELETSTGGKLRVSLSISHEIVSKDTELNFIRGKSKKGGGRCHVVRVLTLDLFGAATCLDETTLMWYPLGEMNKLRVCDILSCVLLPTAGSNKSTSKLSTEAEPFVPGEGGWEPGTHVHFHDWHASLSPASPGGGQR